MSWFDVSWSDEGGFTVDQVAETYFPGGVTADHRVWSEHLRTLLYHCGHALVPGLDGLRFIARTQSIDNSASMQGLDSTGRQHHVRVEPKAGNTTPHGIAWLMGYLHHRATTATALANTFLHTAHYALPRQKVYLAELLTGTETKADRKTPRDQVGERLKKEVQGALEHPLAPDEAVVQAEAARALTQHMGAAEPAALAQPGALWHSFCGDHLKATWTPEQAPVGWLIRMIGFGPEELAQIRDFRARGIDLRPLQVDARTIEPGRRWRVQIVEPLELAQRWITEDRWHALGYEIADRHVDRHPENRGRMAVRAFQHDGDDWLGVGWRGLAGPLEVQFKLNCADGTWVLYRDWWTEGAALQHQKALHKIDAAGKLGNPLEDTLTEEVAAVLNRVWGDVKGIKAHCSDPWDFLRPEA